MLNISIKFDAEIVEENDTADVNMKCLIGYA